MFVGTKVSTVVTVFVRGWFLGFHSNPVQSPGGVFASSKCTVETKKPVPNKDSNNSTNFGTNKHIQKSYIVVPYYSGLNESIKKIGSKYGVKVYFKGGTTIKNLLMAPKDKDPIQKKNGVIYRYKCDRVECDESTLKSPQELLEKGSKNI